MGSKKGYDYTGKNFGRLTVIKDTGKRDPKKGKVWLCYCDCGNKTEGTTVHLNTGNKKSCGCLSKENSTRNIKKANQKWREMNKGKEVKQEPKKIPSLTELINDIPADLKDIPYKMMEDNLFQVFKNGRIFRLNKTKKVECSFHKSNKYSAVTGMVKGKQKSFYVHKLLAEAFIPNPENKDKVIFKDSDPKNLSLDNLMWVTQKELIGILKQKDPFFNGYECKDCGGKTTKKDGICFSCTREIQLQKNKKERVRKNADSVKYLLENIELLTEKQAEAVELRGKGLTLEQIANKLGKSRQAIDNLINSANNRVKRLLGKTNNNNNCSNTENANQQLIILRKKNKLTQNDVAELFDTKEVDELLKEIIL